MTYFKNSALPPMRSLKHLAEICGPFPIKNKQLLLCAERFGFNSRVVEFLQLFPANQVFHSRDSFLESCDELEALIYNEQQAIRQTKVSLKGPHYGYYPAGTAHQARVKDGWRNFSRSN